MTMRNIVPADERGRRRTRKGKPSDPCPSRDSLAVPRRGHVLSATAERLGAPIRAVVAQLVTAIDKNKKAGHACAQSRAYAAQSTDSRGLHEMAAWNLVGMWIVGYSTGAIEQRSTLIDAEAWFRGADAPCLLTSILSRSEIDAASRLLPAADPAAFAELLPYVLDPHGQASRLTVKTRPETKAPRARKRAEGVFYTPEDVADYMVESAVSSLTISARPVVLDPACGTGVFLRASLKAFLRRNPTANPLSIAQHQLFGIDIDPWALDASAFVLLHDCLARSGKLEASPEKTWQSLRANFACHDALLLDPSGHRSSQRLNPRTGRIRLNDLLPAIGDGPHLVVGNPPYADLGNRSDLLELASTFQSLGAAARPSSDVYPLFLEQMVRLTQPTGRAGALVLPLSLGVNTGRQFASARRYIAATPGTWRFAFFDREPHALFGEDVKTRNTILFWHCLENCTLTNVQTGPLRKWRGEDRARMFQTITFTPVELDIAQGIPKLGGTVQANAFAGLKTSRDALNRYAIGLRKATLASIPKRAGHTVYVAGTAYNFLSAFRPFDAKPYRTHGELSEHPVHAIDCATEDDAYRVMALLSSRFAFWWWHTTGDGFHVSKDNIASLPVGSAFTSAEIAAELAVLGRAMWKKLGSSPVVSTNKGKVSLGFNPSSCPELRTEIDHLLMKALNLDQSFSAELDKFTQNVISARIHEPETTEKEQSPMSIKITPEIKEKSKLTKEEWREYTKTVWAIANTSHPDHPAVFPAEIPHRLIKLFSFYGETVLDPFAGTGTTARAAIPLGRRAVCVDQNPKYVGIIKKDCAKLRNGHGPEFEPLKVVHGDSRSMSFQPQNSVGLIVTSPPYWDKADYGTDAKNLGNNGNYRDFIESTRAVFQECMRVLAPGRKLCLVTANVNQHTDHGLLTFPLATDFAVLLRDIGFVMINEIIWSKDGTGGKWGSYGAQRPIFGSYPYPPNFLFKNVHEYVLIFAKPAATKSKGPKVKPYRSLMGVEPATMAGMTFARADD